MSLGVEGTQSPPSTQFDERLAEVAEGESFDNLGATDALSRCVQIANLPGIIELREAAVRQLSCEGCSAKRRYLFSYLSQIERVVNQLTEVRVGQFDA